ncbi:hypothetical protein DFH07DRAFT_869843 [Mycena maculata]|uniref:Uncharacterized protein n=1 Tax=Mycena maculata TaxID=230809 RepID=A0AAD7N4Q4_9AGAR|nr:hypothetical protein DFH07DRAFT_869843 [Mycena maculata]
MLGEAQKLRNLDDKAILRLLNEYHIDKTKYGLGLTRFRQTRESLGLYRMRSQHHNINSIRLALLRLRARYPKAGAREIVSLLFHEENMSYFSVFEPELFWAASVNDIWAVDQHLDPFIRFTHWLKIWWTNSNPRLVLSHYLDENFGLANGHTLIRHFHEPSLRGTLQHRWMWEKKNVMPEISWSQLRHWFTPGLVFRWVFIPWLQKELDSYHEQVNNTAKCADHNKVLPHGVPNDMAEHPGDYGVLDFKLKVEQDAIDMVCALYAPLDHEVFQLVPPDFHAIIIQMYAEIGQPAVTQESCWNIYLQLLGKFCILDNLYNIPQDMDAEWGYALTMACEEHAKDIKLIPNLQPLRNDDVIEPSGFYYMGGVNNGEGLTQLDRMLDEDEPPVAHTG